MEADPLTKTPHSIRDLYEYMGTSKAEWGEQKPWRSRLRREGGGGVGGRERRGALVFG